jgi:hypothetical protein
MTLTASRRLRVLAAGTLLAAAPAAAQQKPNAAEALLQQCQAYVSGNAEVMAQMTCENTIWSILKAMEASKAIDPSFRAPYCKPEGLDLSVERAARIFVEYVNIHPDLLRYPAEHAVLLAFRNAYPCAG